MRSAGFVLAGGQSLRMGRDKALLPWRGTVLAAYVAGEVAKAAGRVTLLGPAARLHGLGFDVLEDLRPGCGPLAALETALSATSADWNLMVACDLPEIDHGTLSSILDLAFQTNAEAVVPLHPDGFTEPLCAVYHTSALSAVRRQLDQKLLKMQDLLRQIQVAGWPVQDPRPFRNVNTPDEWVAHA